MQALKCEVCGGELVLQTGDDLYLCEYCGTKFRRERAKEEAPIGSEGILPVDKLIQNGLLLLELGDYAKALEIFREAADNYPEDYRGWWYIFVCQTKSMPAIRPGKDMLYKTRELENAFRTAPKDIQPDLLRQYRTFAEQCLRKGCEIETAKVARECGRLDVGIATHEAALAIREKRYQEAMKHKGATAFTSMISIAFIIIMLISFIKPSIWMLLTVPLGLLGFLLLLGTHLNSSKKEIEAHAKKKSRLLVLKTIKLVYLDKLDQYKQDLPMRMERLTIADILKQQKYVA